MEIGWTESTCLQALCQQALYPEAWRVRHPSKRVVDTRVLASSEGTHACSKLNSLLRDFITHLLILLIMVYFYFYILLLYLYTYVYMQFANDAEYPLGVS